MNPYEELCQRWPQVLRTPLWRAGGFLRLVGFPGDGALEQILEEASGLLARATRQEWSHPNEAQWRGGQPERFVGGIAAGPGLNTIFGAAAMLETLHGLLGVPVQLAGGGSLSVYSQPGDRLGLHRDIEVCDVTVVTCLWDHGGPSGGSLRTYPEYNAEPLSALPKDRHAIGHTVPLLPGDSALLLGGVVPHEVTAMLPGQYRVVSLVCYRLLDTGV